MSDQDTIAAIASGSGRAGVGVIRISGPHAKSIAAHIISAEFPPPRYALHTSFVDQQKDIIDSGLILYFENPHSFTGEDVVELQGHGGFFVQQSLLARIIELGARVARPGEFSERAFLNGKIDLTQAEAIADLIHAESAQAARAAARSVRGDFSAAIYALRDQLVHIRMYVEAAIDFSEESIDFWSSDDMAERCRICCDTLEAVLQIAQQGAKLSEGNRIVIAGLPNAGKSSLLNALLGDARAIVTDLPGTTRDVIEASCFLGQSKIELLDTAGLRETSDTIEHIGIQRAQAAIANADHVLIVMDSTQLPVDWTPNVADLPDMMPEHASRTWICNKAELLEWEPLVQHMGSETVIRLSAKQNLGISLLREHLQSTLYTSVAHNAVSARTRHCDALGRAKAALIEAQKVGLVIELIAEQLRISQQAIDEITGFFTTDDLLGSIFSHFCVGK